MKDLNKNKILFAVTAVILAVAAFTSTNAKEGSSNETNGKSVAWYVANLKEAKAQNQQCHDKPDLQATPDCVNSLHALQISFVGGN